MSFVSTEPGSDPIIVEGHFPVPPARVFQAWTDPAIVKEWFGPQPGTLNAAEIDLQPGGRWRFSEQATEHSATGFEGQYLKVVPNEMLVFTWAKVTHHASGDRDSTPLSRVEIRFVAAGDGTDMRIVHSKLDTESRTGFRRGWASGTANLAALLSSRGEDARSRVTPTIPAP